MSESKTENTNAKPKRRGRPRKAEVATRGPAPHDRDPKPAPRTPAPIIRLNRRRCHRCGSTDFETHDSRENPAGVRVQHCTCRACGARQIFMFD